MQTMQWLTPEQWLRLTLILAAVAAVPITFNLVGTIWDDWLDERLGRGSIRDWWLLRRIEQDNGVEPGSTP